MVDKEIDDIVNKTLELIENDYESIELPFIDDRYGIHRYFTNKKEYMKLLINGEITNTQRKIHDLIEKYQLEANKKFMMMLVKLDYNGLQFASEKLRNDKEVVREAIKQNGYTIRYASEELKNDKEVVLEAVKQNGKALLYASKELRNDKEVVLEAVRQDGEALNYASKELKNDKEVVLEAVKQKGNAFWYASKELQNRLYEEYYEEDLPF